MGLDNEFSSQLNALNLNFTQAGYRAQLFLHVWSNYGQKFM